MSTLVTLLLLLSATTLVLSQTSICVTSQDEYGDPCNGNGRCRNATIGNSTQEVCVCDPDWGADDCSYHRKPQTLVFLMSFFFGTLGVDRFIMQLWWTAALKLTLGLIGLWLPCVLLCVLGVAKLSASFKADGAAAGLACCLICIIVMAPLGTFAWWLTDVILFGLNKIHDGHGYLMAPW